MLNMTEMGFYYMNMGLASALPNWGDLAKKTNKKRQETVPAHAKLCCCISVWL